MKKYLIWCIGLTLLYSCGIEDKEPVLDPADYSGYMKEGKSEAFNVAMHEVEFWSKRLRPDSSGVGDLGPLAASYTTLFDLTGETDNLSKAEGLYKKAIEISANNKDVYARGLARNYITQHRFREAYDVLNKSYKGVSNKRATQLMLFDVHMELGQYKEAENILAKVKNESDYNYLIRQAKWSDYKGDLELAIRSLEKARDIAESRGSKSLMIWTYSNLADFYGHAGRIEDAYRGYLMTLELDPENYYALRGIAWIAYSYEEDTGEARRILQHLKKVHPVPDYLLLMAEIAELEEIDGEAEKLKLQFVNEVRDGNYGAMYNTYLIEILSENDPSAALELAHEEVDRRATPETYQLLAYALLKNQQEKAALDIIKSKVSGKTYEPMAAYYSAKVYQANKMSDRIENIKLELLDASFEIGPLLTEEVGSW